jgi:hypothetical protein
VRVASTAIDENRRQSRGSGRDDVPGDGVAHVERLVRRDPLGSERVAEDLGIRLGRARDCGDRHRREGGSEAELIEQRENAAVEIRDQADSQARNPQLFERWDDIRIDHPGVPRSEVIVERLEVLVERGRSRRVAASSLCEHRFDNRSPGPFLAGRHVGFGGIRKRVRGGLRKHRAENAIEGAGVRLDAEPERDCRVLIADAAPGPNQRADEVEEHDPHRHRLTVEAPACQAERE